MLTLLKANNDPTKQNQKIKWNKYKKKIWQAMLILNWLSLRVVPLEVTAENWQISVIGLLSKIYEQLYIKLWNMHNWLVIENFTIFRKD